LKRIERFQVLVNISIKLFRSSFCNQLITSLSILISDLDYVDDYTSVRKEINIQARE